MIHISQEQEVVDRLVAWGRTNALIHAMILTSSRAKPNGPMDLLSDYDLILAVSDVRSFAFDDAWTSDFGRPMVRWGDQGEMYGLTTYFRGVVYQNYIKIDYSIWPVELLERITTVTLLPDRRKRITKRSSRSSGGVRPTSPRACGAVS